MSQDLQNKVSISRLLATSYIEKKIREKREANDTLLLLTLLALFKPQQSVHQSTTHNEEMMMAFLMMNQQKNESESNSRINLDEIIRMKVFMPLLDSLGSSSNELSPVEHKFLEEMRDREKDATLKTILDKFLKDQQHSDELKEVKEQSEKQRKEDLQKLKGEFVDRLEALQKPENRDVLDKVTEFTDLKKSFDVAYAMLNPERKDEAEQNQSKTRDEEWNPKDYIEAVKNTVDAIPGAIVAARGITSIVNQNNSGHL